MANDISKLIAELRRRNDMQSQSQMGGAPTFQGTPSVGGPMSAPQQYDQQQQPQAGGQNMLEGLNNANRASGGRLYDKMGTAAKSGWRSLMGNTGLPGSGSMLGGQTTGTLANAGAQNVGAGMMGPMSGSTLSFPGAMGASGAQAGGGLGGMMGGAGAVAWPAAAVLALDKLGISPAKETFKGYAPSNIMEKIGIKGSGGGSGGVTKMGKGIIQFMGGDFKHGWKNTADSVKDIFRLKLF